MSAATITRSARNLFILSTSIGSVGSRLELIKAGRGLVGLAERAYSVRGFEIISKAGQTLSDTPFCEVMQGYGEYFTALATNRLGKGEPARALRMFLGVSERAADRLRAKALVGAASAARCANQSEQALELYSAAMDIAVRSRGLDAVPFLQSLQGIAIVQSGMGDNSLALATLRSGLRYLPTVLGQDAFSGLEYLNSLAVELGTGGRPDEARQVIRYVLSSPIARYHRDWFETRDEIEAMDPKAPTGRVYMPSNMGHLARNVVEFPQRPPTYAEEEKDEGAELQEVVNKNVIWSQERSLTPALIRQNAEHHLNIRKYQESVDRKEQGGTPDTDGGATGKAG